MFRADSATGNNDRENYDCSEELNPSWNVNGTNEFWLTDCTVTSVVLEYGSPVTDGGQDSANTLANHMPCCKKNDSSRP